MSGRASSKRSTSSTRSLSGIRQGSLSFEPGTGAAHNGARLDGLGPGLSYLIIHPAEGGNTLAEITTDWRQRDEERRLYSDGTMASALEERGFETLGMRPLRDWLRAQSR